MEETGVVRFAVSRINAKLEPELLNKLQGQSTLTDAEKVTEMRKHVEALMPELEKMNGGEQAFVKRFADQFKQYGDRTFVSNKQLFWARDLRMKY